LAQKRADVEIVVVDDGSTDNTCEVVRDLRDERIVYVRHSTNRGVCPSRNTGVERARGEWVVFLDSDDELVPEALSTLYHYINQLPSGVDRVAGMYRWDDGGCSPDPHPGIKRLDYEKYIRWTVDLRRSDFHNCIRRSTFETVRLPESRAYETLYHLDFARHFDTLLVPHIVALAHQDAVDRMGKIGRGGRARRYLRDAPDAWRETQRMVATHGTALRQWAPGRLKMMKRGLVLYAFLCGERRVGIRCAFSFVREYGIDERVVAAALLGTIEPRLLALAQGGR
jgi:glycosyltransferase involved in cell wall biosynthesis